MNVKVQVQVTKEDIETNRERHADRCSTCPVANAIKRLVNTNLHVRVNGVHVLFFDRDAFHRVAAIDLPTKVQDHIWALDKRPGEYTPFEFSLNIPKELLNA